MRKNSKKILTASLIASFALTTALGVSVFAMPKAEADFSDFTMDTGAGVRMDTPTGIRFTANVGAKTKASLENATDVTFGMLIAPTTGADDVLTLDDVTDASVKAKNLVTAVWADGSTDWTVETAVKYNGAIVGGETVDFPKDEYATVLNAVGYVTYTVDDVTTTVYTTSMANRSLAQAASNSLANGVADPNGVLSGIVSEVVNSVSFADETIELTLNATKAESATVSASADVNTDLVTVTYESNNPSVATVDIYGNVTAKSEGNATITASAGNVTDTLDVVVEGSTTLLNDCAAVGSVGRTAWGWPTLTTTNDSLTTVETTAPVDVPASYNGSSKNTNYTSQQTMKSGGTGADGRVVPAFEIPSFFNNIENYDDKDYLGVWVYVEATSSVLWDSYFTVSKGQPHLANSAYTATNQKQFPYADSIPTNTWTMLTIPVSSIRTAMATNTNVDSYDTLVLDLRYGGNSGKVYYYAIDVYPWELLNDCADTATVTDTTWNNSYVPTTMAVSEVGYPDASVYTGNAISDSVMKQKISMGNNVCQSSTAFYMPTFFDTIADLDMNDYVGIWMYYQSSTDDYIDSVILSTTVGRPYTSYAGYSTTVSNSNCLPTNQWVMVKIGVDEIRASMSKNATLAFDTLCIEVRSAKYTSSAEYVYFYSVDAYEVEGTTATLNTCDNTSKVSMSAWNNTNSNAVVSTAPVDVPTDYAGAKTGTSYMQQNIFVKSANKLAQHIPTFSIPTLCGNLAYLEDTDYLGLWVYVEAPEGTTKSNQLFVGLSTELTAPNNNTSSNGTHKQTELSEQVATNTWTMIKIPISTIRSLVEANPTIAFTYLYIDYRVNTVYYDSAETEKMYLYALDLYTGA